MITENSVLNSRYRLEKRIGQGGFAQVFLATDLVLERKVAVKVLNPELTEDSDFLDRFGREARAIAALDHPNILTVHDYGQAEGTAYLVMPYVEGGTLYERLRREKKLPLQQTGLYLQQVAAALDYAHRRSIVHRDIKPQNMLLRAEDDRLLLADFGIAKVLSSASAQSLTGALGTISYMAPEQLGGNVSLATDIYALGCVLFQMLTGQLPYTGPTEQVVVGHLTAPVPSVYERSQGLVPRDLQWIFDRALAKKPEARFQTAGEMAGAFLAATGNAQTATRPVSTANDQTVALETPPRPLTPTRPRETAPEAREPAPPAPPRPGGPGPAPTYVPAGTPGQPYQAPPPPPVYGFQGGPAAPPAHIPPAGTPSQPYQATPLVQPPRKKPNLALIGVIVAVVVLLAAGGATLLLLNSGKSNPAGTPVPGDAAGATPASGFVDEGKIRNYSTIVGHDGVVRAVAFSPDGKLLASAGDDKTVRGWDLVNRKPYGSIKGQSETVRAVAFSPDGKLLASGGDDKEIKLWDVASGNALRTLTGHTEAISSLAFTADGKTLISGSFDTTVKLWDVATGQAFRTFNIHKGAVFSVVRSSDGATVASAGEDDSIIIWDSGTGQISGSLKGHTAPVNTLALTSDDKILASGSDDNTVKLWDIAGRKELRTLNGHTDKILSLVFSRDNLVLASGSADNSIRLWEVSTGRQLLVLTGQTGPVDSLALSPDGKYLASGSSDNTIRLWQVPANLPLTTPAATTTRAPVSSATPAATTAAPVTAPATTAAATSAPPATTRASNTPPPALSVDRAAIEKALAGLPGTTSVTILLPDGESITDDAERAVPSASTIKLWIAGTVFEEAKAGRLNLAENYTVKDTDVVSGTGILVNNVGKTYTLERLVAITLAYSDNSGANILIDKLGGFAKVNSYAQRNGYNQTRLQRRLADVSNPNNNFTSSRDAALFVQRMLQGEIVDKASSDRIIAALQERRSYAADQNYFGKKLPPSLDYRHISGTGTRLRNEIGYFDLAGPDTPVIIAILITDASESDAENGIASAVAVTNQSIKR